MTPHRSELVLAVYPMARGYAFALFEGPYSPVDWGISRTYGPLKNRRCLTAVRSLIERCKPDCLVLQRSDGVDRHRARRVRELNESLIALADELGVAAIAIPRSTVRQRFAAQGFATKQLMAEAVARYLPSFERFVPPIRKPWMSEDRRMGLFEAIALVLVYFQTTATDPPL
jgi:hypothetical protein